MPSARRQGWLLLFLAAGLLLLSGWVGVAWAASAQAGGAPGRATAALPSPSGFPIQHIVVIAQENHAYDNLFGVYCPATGAHCPSAANGIPAGTCVPKNPAAPKRGCIAPYAFTTPSSVTRDLAHNWRSSHVAYNNGSMNGFYQSEGGSNQTFGYFTGQTIPYYWDLAEEYGLGDNFFSASLSYSLPNHWQLVGPDAPYAAEHYFLQSGSRQPLSAAQQLYLGEANTTTTLLNLLQNTSVSWKYYDRPLLPTYTAAVADRAGGGAFSFWNPLAAQPQTYAANVSSHFVGRSSILADAANGTLPNVSWVMPTMAYSDHPPQNLTLGQEWVGSVVNAIERSPEWNSTAIFLTWDEYGGFYDHVAPPTMNVDGLGFRVPLLVMSPYTPEGYVDPTLEYFPSLVHLIEWRWGLSSLGSFDANATLPLGYFDPGATPRAPLVLPNVTQGVRYPYAYQNVGLPGSPGSFAATPGSSSGTVRLTWSAPIGGAPPSYYQLSYGRPFRPAGHVLRIGAQLDAFNVTNLTPGARYAFSLRAADPMGLSGASNVSLLAPQPPSFSSLRTGAGSALVFPDPGIAGTVHLGSFGGDARAHRARASGPLRPAVPRAPAARA